MKAAALLLRIDPVPFQYTSCGRSWQPLSFENVTYWPVAGVACFVLLTAGYIVTTIITLLLTAYGFIRHTKSIGRRAMQGHSAGNA